MFLLMEHAGENSMDDKENQKNAENIYEALAAHQPMASGILTAKSKSSISDMS